MYQPLTIVNLLRFLAVASILVVVGLYTVSNQTGADAEMQNLRVVVTRQNPTKTTGPIATYQVRESMKGRPLRDPVVAAGHLTVELPKATVADLMVGDTYSVELSELEPGFELVDASANQNPRQVRITAGAVNVVTFEVVETAQP